MLLVLSRHTEKEFTRHFSLLSNFWYVLVSCKSLYIYEEIKFVSSLAISRSLYSVPLSCYEKGSLTSFGEGGGVHF